MARLTTADITDELIRPVVVADQTILDEADAYLDDLARSKGYMLTCLSKAEYTIDDIPTPLPYKVKRLAVMFVCREVCARKAGSAAGAAFRDQQAGDKWSSKLPYFARQVEILEGQITPEVLLGIVTSSSVGQITIERA